MKKNRIMTQALRNWDAHHGVVVEIQHKCTHLKRILWIPGWNRNDVWIESYSRKTVFARADIKSDKISNSDTRHLADTLSNYLKYFKVLSINGKKCF